MTVEYIKDIFNQIELIDSRDENSYEKILLQLMKIPHFPVLLWTMPAKTPVFRSRTNETDIFFENISDISLTPNRFIQSFGRCNRPFQCKFYASENRPTSFMELVEYWSEKKGEGDSIYVTIGRWILEKEMTVILITTPDNDKRETEYDTENGKILDQFIAQSDVDIQEGTKEIYRYFFDKFRKPSKGDLKNYLITSAITNLSLSLSEGSADAIMYPSVPFGGQGDNFAISKNFLDDKHLSLTNVLRNKLEITLNEYDKFNFTEVEKVESKGIDTVNNVIIW